MTRTHVSAFAFKLLPAGLLGVAAALLISCGSSPSGLIPAASAGPLQSDFEAVAKAARSGNGSCAATEAALGKTEQDFLALPASVDRGLRARLDQGISNLHEKALAMCAQPTTPATTATSQATTPTQTINTATETTPTATTPTQTTSTATTPTTTAPSGQGGGTEAPGEGAESSESKGLGKGKGEGLGKQESQNAEQNGGGASPGGGQ